MYLLAQDKVQPIGSHRICAIAVNKHERALLDLIDTIYLCGSGNEDWQVFLDQYGRLFPSLKSALTGYDNRFSDVEVFCTSNYDLAFIDTYQAHYYKLNPWQDIIRTGQTVPFVSWAPEIPVSRLQKSEFFADWIRPQDNVAYGFTTMLFNEPHRFINFTSNVNPTHIEEARRAAKSLTIIGPHLRRAFELSRQLKGMRVHAEGIQAAFDLLATAAFIVDANGTLRFANAAAERLLARGELVRSTPAGHLDFVHADDRSAIANCLGRAEMCDDRDRPEWIALRSRTGGRYWAFVTRLVMQNRERTLRDVTASNPIAILVIDTTDQPQAPVEHIAAALKLTAAEARLAWAMLQNKTLQEYADERAISVHTARIQMRSLLGKTDSRRQAELMHLLAKLFTKFVQ
jgi:DNA-binding CsgD family transcriptional regulator/PAS domain-containing protein